MKTVRTDLSVSYKCPACGHTSMGSFGSLVDVEIEDAASGGDGGVYCIEGSTYRLFGDCASCKQRFEFDRY